MRRPGLLLPVLTALACSATGGRNAAQILVSDSANGSAQAPLVTCMDAVLAGSSLLERVTASRGDNPSTRYLVLRNPPSERSRSMRFAVEPSRGAPRELVVEFTWPGRWQGTNGMMPAPDPNLAEGEGQAMSEIGARLLQDVRSHCARSAPGEPVCSKVADGRMGRCVVGA